MLTLRNFRNGSDKKKIEANQKRDRLQKLGN